ncbi:MAG: hypothetical protein HN849_12270 [Victivallales bacterium]|nr:hypothetical protein [Victivallales bacterium]
MPWPTKAQKPHPNFDCPYFSKSCAGNRAYNNHVIALWGLSFLTELGHAAMPLGNQRVASVPLAIRAGLGARGRNGLLLHPDHGPCLRLAKVLTDLPLASDAAGSTEVAAVCLSCDACVVGCPAGAIAAGRDTQGASSACPDYWRQGHRGCARCIAACPASG